jgi:hypothetical protein
MDIRELNMAFFDQFGNLTPDQTQGLLAAAAQILQQSGPSRTPTSIGQILGGGLQAYQGSIQQQEQLRREREAAAQQAKLLGLKVQDAESDLANQAAARKRAADLQAFYRSRGAGNPAATVPVGQTADLAPTVENASRLPSMPQAPRSIGIFQNRIAEAQALRNAGFGQEADAAEAAALKLQPKVKGWEKVTQNGRVLFAPFFEDGSSGQPVPLDVAEKLQEVNLGGTTQLVNPFTGVAAQSLQRTQSPDSAASVAATIRGQDLNFRSAGLDRAQRATTEKAPTEFQGKSAAFGLRAQEADKILTELTGKYSPAAINSKNAVESTPLLGGILGAATNYALSENDQRAEQAQRDFINAVLRQESGAAIGASEFDNARRQYFPQPNDGSKVIAQKARDRQLAIQGLNTNAGRARMSAPAAPSAGGWSIQRVGD